LRRATGTAPRLDDEVVCASLDTKIFGTDRLELDDDDDDDDDELSESDVADDDVERVSTGAANSLGESTNSVGRHWPLLLDVEVELLLLPVLLPRILPPTLSPTAVVILVVVVAVVAVVVVEEEEVDFGDSNGDDARGTGVNANMSRSVTLGSGDGVVSIGDVDGAEAALDSNGEVGARDADCSHVISVDDRSEVLGADAAAVLSDPVERMARVRLDPMP
jgi:hypothetical protein